VSEVRAAEGGEDVLRRRLPGRPSDPDNVGVRPRADRPPDRSQRRECVVRDERGSRARGVRLVEELDAAADRDEQVTWPDSP